MSDNEKSDIALPLFQAPVSKRPTEPKKKPAKASGDENEKNDNANFSDNDNENGGTRKRTRTRDKRPKSNENGESDGDDSVKSGSPRSKSRDRNRNRANDRSEKGDRPRNGSGSTRMSSKKNDRRKDMRSGSVRRGIITEAEFLAERDDVERKMIIRSVDDNQQVALVEDNSLVEFYVSEQANASVVGNVYLGVVQNVLPGMEAAFVDIGVGRNGVLYAGEVNWKESELVDGQPKRIEQVLNKGDQVLVQATKDPIGNKGARLTSQVTLAGRYLVLVPSSGISGISKKIPDRERRRLKEVMKDYEKEEFGIIFRTSANGVEEEALIADIERLKKRWNSIDKKAQSAKKPTELYGESDLWKRVIRETLNSSYSELILAGDNDKISEIEEYIADVVPDLSNLVSKWSQKADIFDKLRINEQLAKALDRKVWLPSGGTLVIDRTEAMTVIDINTGKFTGSKTSSLEETVTANNLEAAEEIVRQLRLRDIGGIIIIDFIDMILEDNREAVLRRLVECLMRDKTKHQVAEVTTLGLVQVTRKRVGQGLVEAYSTDCEYCGGKGYIVHDKPVHKDINAAISAESPEGWFDNFVGASHELEDGSIIEKLTNVDDETREKNREKMAAMAAKMKASAVVSDENSDEELDEKVEEKEQD